MFSISRDGFEGAEDLAEETAIGYSCGNKEIMSTELVLRIKYLLEVVEAMLLSLGMVRERGFGVVGLGIWGGLGG